MSEGNALQISSLPPLPSAEASKVEQEPLFRSIPVIKSTSETNSGQKAKTLPQHALPALPALQLPTETQTQPRTSGQQSTQQLQQYSDVFESALSQFPQHRIARLPVAQQDSAPIIESSRFEERPTMQSVQSARRSVLENVVQNPDSDSESGQSLLNSLEQQGRFKPASSNKMLQEFAELPQEQNPLTVESAPIEESFAPINAVQPEAPSTAQSDVPSLAPAAEAAPLQWEVPQTMATVPEIAEPGDLAYPLNPQMPANEFSPESNFATPRAIAAAPVDESLTWWKSSVLQPLDGNRSTEAVDSNVLVYRALQNSPRIQAVSQSPLIRELQIVEADAEFDAVQYIQSQFEDRVDPVGNQLTVGNGESFLKDNIWSGDLGLRKKARTGASWELNQRLGFQNSNSNFFVPQDQGTATLALNVTQPLLRGRGRYYNQSQILIAQATNGAAWQTFHAELQDELLGVVSAYWDLYLTRSVFLQKRRNVERGAKILDRLEGRAGLDSLPSQIARARSSVQTRRTELANALRDVRNAETEVRRRIADNSWINGGGAELVPGELPSAMTFQVPLEQVVYNALQHRPEVQEAMSRVRIASVQRDVSANELLPELSLLMGTYVSALRGDTGILNAFQDQFGQVKPGYSFGVNFELPYGNRAARSRLAQRDLQVKKIRHEVDEVMQTVIAESQVALRRVESAAETLVAANEAIKAAHADRNQFQRRWESFALVEGDLADGQNPTTVLDQLLDSQDRLASAELVYVQAERELKVAEVALQRSMGTLLMAQNVSTTRGFDCDTPRMDIFKDGSPLPTAANGIPGVAAPQMDATQANFNGFPQ
ncbi:TolC family protein [Mariniblastus fucicola]|uniref:TolC family protein n=1 Tax=Mariniblastus fucicola TaxID=980251 RepID=UPI0012FC0309|nr:TolC family protein [Mariniblastus fucicola]